MTDRALVRRSGTLPTLTKHAGQVLDFDVTLDLEDDGTCVVKLSSDEVELNVRASAADLERLDEIGSARWETRQSLQVGRVSGASAFWASDGVTATVLVGADDETWDLAVTVPLQAVAEIVRLAAEHT